MWSLNILLLLFVLSPRSADASYDWDFLIFTQSWPSAVCRVWTESNPSHSCTLPEKRDAWSIHGIWPSVAGSMGPAFCNKTWLFDPEEVKPIESDLEQSWVNVEKGTPTYDFWAHEWNKHGTCAAAIEPLNSQMKYFSTGLKFLKKYTMANILSEANIVPSDNKLYTQNDVYQAIKNKLGVIPEIYCKHDKGKQYLWELRICLSKQLNLIDCKATMNRETFLFDNVHVISNCNREIIYTESIKPPNRILVQLYKLTTWLQWFTL